MWTRNMLERVAETVTDPELKAELQNEISRIEFDPGTQVCDGPTARQAFVNASVERVCDEASSMLAQFTNQDDLRQLENARMGGQPN